MEGFDKEFLLDNSAKRIVCSALNVNGAGELLEREYNTSSHLSEGKYNFYKAKRSKECNLP